MSIAVAGVLVLYVQGHKRFPVLLPIIVLMAIALLAKKRYPLPTLAACLTLSGLLALLIQHPYTENPGDLVALYAVGRYCPRWTAVITGLATTAYLFLATELITELPPLNTHNASQLAWVALAILAGAWVRTQRLDVVSAQERAERSEREHEDEARRRVAEERVRIARELHDIVGHALMSINVLSTVSARLVERDPKSGRDALRTISGVSNTALREIRSTLGLLREGSRPVAHPERGVEDLMELLEQARASGLPVTMRETGACRDVPAIIGFTVYRIVQESLTNITRHAENVTKVTVDLLRAPGRLDVTVVNDGAPAKISEDGGIGIKGMRERVTAIGGCLEVRTLSDGGFRVHARLPVKEAS